MPGAPPPTYQSAMAAKHPDRIPLRHWRSGAETVAEMRAQGWSVISICMRCGLKLEVSLELIERVIGGRASLWQRTQRCRQVGCGGPVRFHGRPCGRSFHELLDAPWPEGKPPLKAPARGKGAGG